MRLEQKLTKKNVFRLVPHL